MIDIINGYEFKRNLDNTVVYPISKLATILGIHPHVAKEHYYYCVLDSCLSEGEIHIEQIEKGEIELYLPVYNVQQLIESLDREGFGLEEFQKKQVVDSMLETQRIVSECFEAKNGFLNYNDPIRKHKLPFIKPISESISKIKDN